MTESKVSASLQVLAETLEKLGWNFELRTDRSLLQTRIVGNSGCWYDMTTSVKNGLLMLLVCYPFTVPEEKRARVAELAVRENNRQVGKIDMDFSTGQVCVQACAIVPNDGMIAECVPDVLGFAIVLADKFFHPLMSAIHSDDIPEAAPGEHENVDMPEDVRRSLEAMRAEFLSTSELDAEDIQLDLP